MLKCTKNMFLGFSAVINKRVGVNIGTSLLNLNIYIALRILIHQLSLL